MSRSGTRRGDFTQALLIAPPSSEPLILGEDLSIAYHVAAETRAHDLELHIANKTGTVVFKADGLSVEPGDHVVVWVAGKWNQAPHKGALANPANDPYSIHLRGTRDDVAGGGSVVSNVIEVGTRLVLTATFDKPKPSPQEISSGLYRPAFDLKSPERIRVGLLPKAGGNAIFATEPPSFSDMVEEDLDNNPANGLELKSARFRQVMQSTLVDGEYRVVIENLRDLAGNEGANGADEKGVFADWVVNLR